MSRRVGLAAALVALATALYVLHVPLLCAAGRFLVEEDPLRSADAILVLAGSIPDRALEAAALYQEGYAPRILFSREPVSPLFAQTHALGVMLPRAYELNRWVAEQLGVPPAAIGEVGGTGQSTLAEAREIVRELLAEGHRDIVLVSSKLHTRRSALIWRHVAAGELRIIVRPSRYDPFDPDSWWRQRTWGRRVVFEYQKLLFFLLVERWRAG